MKQQQDAEQANEEKDVGRLLAVRFKDIQHTRSFNSRLQQTACMLATWTPLPP